MQKHTPVALRLKLLLDGREVVHQMVALVVLQRERILRLAAAHLAASHAPAPASLLSRARQLLMRPWAAHGAMNHPIGCSPVLAHEPQDRHALLAEIGVLGRGGY
jgi:hypothetical protein